MVIAFNMSPAPCSVRVDWLSALGNPWINGIHANSSCWDITWFDEIRMGESRLTTPVACFYPSENPMASVVLDGC